MYNLHDAARCCDDLQSWLRSCLTCLSLFFCLTVLFFLILEACNGHLKKTVKKDIS